MTKLWYAGAAVASGFLLFAAAAAPAQAAVPLDGRRPLTQLPSADVLGGGLLPDGQQQSFDPLARPTAGEPESTTNGAPLLGGALPVSSHSVTPGFPGGGMAVLAPAVANATDPAATHPPAAIATTAPPVTAPARHKHKVKPAAAPTPTPSSIPADPRLHEEPIDGEATHTFSPNGRPVVAIDQ